MPETIVVQLNATPETKLSWLVLNEEKAVVTPASYSTLNEISKHCQDKTIITLLPPEEVLLLTVTLPVIKKNQLIQAIPFAIQEELSDKAERYHFKILDEQDSSGKIHIAVIEKERLHYWHQLLSEYQIEAHYFIPTLLAAPYQLNCVKIMAHENTCIVRSGKYAGFVTDKENLNALLDIYLSEIEKPEKIILQHYGSTEPNAMLTTHPNIAIETQPLPESYYLTDLAQGALNNLHGNLLWGKLLSHSKSEKVKLYWQMAIACMIAIILIAVLNKIVQYSVYSSQNAALNKKIAAVYQENFPNSTSMVAPKMRLEDKLKALNDLATSNPYLDLLGSTGQILKETSLLSINAIQFGNNTLSLDVTSQNFADLNEITHQLTAKGLQITQHNAKAQGNTVSTTLLIKEST